MASEKPVPNCHACGQEYVVIDRVGRGETCRRCGADLRCCRNCAFYDPGAYNECHESMADRVVEKAQANFCDYFEPAQPVIQGTVKVEDKTAEAKRRLNALFKKT